MSRRCRNRWPFQVPVLLLVSILASTQVGRAQDVGSPMTVKASGAVSRTVPAPAPVTTTTAGGQPMQVQASGQIARKVDNPVIEKPPLDVAASGAVGRPNNANVAAQGVVDRVPPAAVASQGVVGRAPQGDTVAQGVVGREPSTLAAAQGAITREPSEAPVTTEPTSQPTHAPTTEAPVTSEPTSHPTNAPTTEEPITLEPTRLPTSLPTGTTATSEPTEVPTAVMPVSEAPTTATIITSEPTTTTPIVTSHAPTQGGGTSEPTATTTIITSAAPTEGALATPTTTQPTIQEEESTGGIMSFLDNIMGGALHSSSSSEEAATNQTAESGPLEEEDESVDSEEEAIEAESEEEVEIEPDNRAVNDTGYQSKQNTEYRNETIAFEDFESGNDHSWTNQRVAESEFFTNFLGRFGQAIDGTNAFTNTSKTYLVPPDAERVEITFDFYELDLWCHCDHLTVMICNQTVDMGVFSESGASNQSDITHKGPRSIEWFRRAEIRNADLGFSQFRDGLHHMGLSVPRRCYKENGGFLELKFNLTIDGDFEITSGGIDNINVTAYEIPPEDTDPPTIAPSPMASEQPTPHLYLDICVSDVMYDYALRQTVHRKCFDMFAKGEPADESERVGEACVEAIDDQSFRLQVKPKGTWEFQNASAWTGESLDDVPREPGTNLLNHDGFHARRSWGEGEEDDWVVAMPLMHAHEHCYSGVSEFADLLIVHVTASDSSEGNATFSHEAYAKEHYYKPGDFFWAHLVFSCQCDRDIELEPEPTGVPSPMPSISPTLLPSSSPTMVPTSAPSTAAPTEEKLEKGVSKCIASNDGSGRECHPLIGQDGTRFGRVCVELIEDEQDPNDVLNVTYTVYDQYRLTRKYLWVGEDSESQVPVIRRELSQPEPDLDAFPHYSCNFLGTRSWEKLVPIGPRCHKAKDGTVIPFSLVAHSEVAPSQRDGTVALGTIGAKAFAIDHTQGNVEDDSWYEIVNFRVACQCQYMKGSSGWRKFEGVPESPTKPPAPNPTDNPTTAPSIAPSYAPSVRPSTTPSNAPSQMPSAVPSSRSPTPAPTLECRPAWAMQGGPHPGHSHCFKTIGSVKEKNETVPYGWYNGVFHLHQPEQLTLFAEAPNDKDAAGDDECTHGMRVGQVQFSYASKVVTVKIETLSHFYMTETQAHVGPDMLPTDLEDGSYITNPMEFELIHEGLGEATQDFHYLRGCQEDNWVVVRAVVCGPFSD
ncbi:Calcium-binding EGF domain [Seminavis robusta]|uniref:Calcium-binding EGF domain n=1 Tax=Seminavis robusta TaxID=568900 RepID=A0A9N8H5P7_9STRA|nr:Calcium-binding EGF domain [Seminavis robusta]|eukprot:Sro80_g042930.1 Calcium-binding EGF domain (1219) ;mRNA; f:10034-14172